MTDFSESSLNELERQVIDYFSWANPRDIAKLIGGTDCKITKKFYTACLKKLPDILAETIDYLDQATLDEYFPTKTPPQ